MDELQACPPPKFPQIHTIPRLSLPQIHVDRFVEHKEKNE